MALLETLQEVAELGGLPRPTAIVGSTDTTARQLLAIANERGQEAARLYDWPQLIISSTLTLVADEIQPLPYDVAEVLDLTAWYSADMTPLTGPITYIEWQRMKQTAVAPIKYSFRVANTSFGKPALAFVPTPTGGQIISTITARKHGPSRRIGELLGSSPQGYGAIPMVKHGRPTAQGRQGQMPQVAQMGAMMALSSGRRNLPRFTTSFWPIRMSRLSLLMC